MQPTAYDDLALLEDFANGRIRGQWVFRDHKDFFSGPMMMTAISHF